MRVGLLQFCSNRNVQDNLKVALCYFDLALEKGAGFIASPEVSNIIAPYSHLAGAVRMQAQDLMLSAFQEKAARNKVWVLLGSLALAEPLAKDRRLVNRSLLIGPDGDIKAHYDKIHMFDVEISPQETCRESLRYRPGQRAVLVDMGDAKLGMQICYDMRFAYLSRQLALAGATILSFPSAFSIETGPAHWEVLLRARAIETGCFVIAPAQTGQNGKTRASYGHSLIVNPWGDVILDAGRAPGAYVAELNLDEVGKARGRLPCLSHGREVITPHE